MMASSDSAAICTALVSGVLYSSVAFVGERGEPVQRLDLRRTWQHGPYCGVNTLYCLMRAEGVEVSRDELMRVLSPGHAGNSLQELQEAARHYGLGTTVVKATPPTLKKLPLPFIAHLELPGGKGHFLLVFGVSERGVDTVDGRDLAVVTMHPSVFVRNWSGYALVVGGRWARALLYGLLYGELAAVGLLGMYALMRRSRRAREDGG